MAVVLGMCIGVLNMVPYLQLISIPVALLLKFLPIDMPFLDQIFDIHLF